MKISTDKLTWSRDTRCFSTEASSLKLPAGKWPEKITIFNPKTKQEADFFIQDNPMMFNGEFMGYRYDNASTIVLKIFND